VDDTLIAGLHYLPAMSFFRTEQTTIHYLERGSGEPVLLLHGLGCTGADWAFQVAALEHRFRVIVPDLPGSGHSPAPRDGSYCIATYATAMWKLVDHLNIPVLNIVGFSLGGAVAFEMAAQRPRDVTRIGVINSLANYRPHSVRKWLETYLAAGVVKVIGMERAAYIMAARLFPESWQRRMRDHTAAAVGAIPAAAYLGMGFALASWQILDRLHLIRPKKTLLIAAEMDFTPLAEKVALAKDLNSILVVVKNSRHGTPFDSVEATNAALLAFLQDEPLPESAVWERDLPSRTETLTLAGSIAEEHALSPLLID
jgi:3-oxoadipate enol-lactonase